MVKIIKERKMVLIITPVNGTVFKHKFSCRDILNLFLDRFVPW